MDGVKKAFQFRTTALPALIWLLAGIYAGVGAQTKSTEKKDGQRCLMFNGFAAYSIPTGDLARDYGAFGEIGGGIQYQTKKKWIMGIDGGYLFGNGVKKDPIPNIRNADGNVVGTDGSDAVFKVFQRATAVPVFRFGKTFSLKKPGRNSLGGITCMASAGWLRHWTYIQDLSKKTPQFSDDYRRGYDRLSGGSSVGLWAGYLYLPDNGKLNLHAEMGYTMAFTSTYRYDFPTGTPAGKSRNDGLFQIRLRLCFTVKSRSEDTIYYN